MRILREILYPFEAVVIYAVNCTFLLCVGIRRAGERKILEIQNSASKVWIYKSYSGD